MIKQKIVIQYVLLVLLLLLLFNSFDISLFDFYLCDSGPNENIDENVYDNNYTNDDTTRDLAKLDLLDRLRRRFSWYFSGKSSGTFNSYDEFKSSWDPKSKVWNEVKSFIKEDLKKSRLNAFKSRESSRENAENIMYQIRESRKLKNLENLKRFNDRFNKK